MLDNSTRAAVFIGKSGTIIGAGIGLVGSSLSGGSVVFTFVSILFSVLAS